MKLIAAVMLVFALSFGFAVTDAEPAQAHTYQTCRNDTHYNNGYRISYRGAYSKRIAGNYWQYYKLHNHSKYYGLVHHVTVTPCGRYYG